jgi:DNA uptake protein ComE-like DNA-binding protein
LPYIVTSKSETNLIKYRSDIDSFLKNQKLLRDSVNIEFLQNSGEIDMAIASQKIKPFEFNPNKLPVEAWKKLGLTDKQISTIKNYEAAGGKFKRKEDLKKIYSISDIEYKILEPYINIPSLYKSKTGKVIKKKTSPKIIIYKNTDINSANSDELRASLGLSSWLANRTVSYRDILGGYINAQQLKEVYGFNDSIFRTVEKHVIIDTCNIVKIDINNVEFNKLLKHPYFDYNTTKSLFNTRNKIGSFSSFDQLKLIDGINDSIYNKVKYYLYFQPLDN